MIPENRQTVRRSLSARALACDVGRMLVNAAKRPQDMRESERNEIAECLTQAAEFLRSCEPHSKEIAALIKGKLG